jgi:hypothetical protein
MDCVAVMEALVSVAGAWAAHTSAVPGWVLARFTNDQFNPPPDTVKVCPELGPSADPRASSQSPAFEVVTPDTVTGSFPWADFWASTASPLGGGVALDTVTVTGVAVAVTPEVLVATADSWWEPLATLVESQLI